MKQKLQENLLYWFERNQRELPWRQDRDPYKIWVSEIMLQQTRVDTVIPYYERFMTQFPTINDLAEAGQEQVLKAWEGLGYYSRVKNLHSAVKEVAASYGGIVPDTPEQIAGLKGVGPYTAGAILSIAFGLPVPAVDGNVMRVISRLFNLDDDIAKDKTRKKIEAIVADLIPEGAASFFNQALMELGALICTPKSPKCLLCPVNEQCEARKAGREQELPVKSKAKKPRNVELVTAVVLRNGRVLFEQRPEAGLLGAMWQFPTAEINPEMDWKENISAMLKEDYGLAVGEQNPLMDVQHVFTHLVWHMHVFTCRWQAGEINEGLTVRRWVTLEEMKQLPLPVAHQKIMNQLLYEASIGGNPNDNTTFYEG